MLACRPRLVGVKPALEVVPAMRPDLILHAAPPTSWDELSPLLRSSLTAAAEFEGLSPREAELGAAQDFGSMAGGAGAITASTPVVVIEDAASGRRAFHFLMEGFGRTLILGSWIETGTTQIAAPVLAELPVVGELFKTSVTTEMEVIVLATVQVIRTEQPAK